MLVLGAVPHEASTHSEAFLDAASLVLLSTPPIYWWVIKPFVDARDEALAQVSHLAHVDPLTQLANRRLLSKHLQRAVAGIVRHRIYGALLLLDLDGFKLINDAHGHDAGDAVLVEIAKRMQSITRSEDIVARLARRYTSAPVLEYAFWVSRNWILRRPLPRPISRCIAPNEQGEDVPSFSGNEKDGLATERKTATRGMSFELGGRKKCAHIG